MSDRILDTLIRQIAANHLVGQVTRIDIDSLDPAKAQTARLRAARRDDEAEAVANGERSL